MRPRILTLVFADIYPMYIQKAERKGRTRDEVDEVICWLTGYDAAGLTAQIEARADMEEFFTSAPGINPAADKITGVICGIRVEEIEDPLIQQVRRMDKVIDELAKGKAMEKILRVVS